MSARSLGAAALCAALICSSPVSAAKAVSGPTGWDHTGHNVNSDNSQTTEIYTTGSGDFKQMLIVLSDSATPYTAVLDKIHHNVADTKMQVNVDKDQPCAGQTARTLEFVFGPDVKRIKVDRLVIPDGTGSVQITYTRPEPEPYADAVKTVLTGFCSSS